MDEKLWTDARSVADSVVKAACSVVVVEKLCGVGRCVVLGDVVVLVP